MVLRASVPAEVRPSRVRVVPPRSRRSSTFRALLALFITAGALAVPGPLGAQCEPGPDCNGNGLLDSCDILFGASDDCDLDGIPDECALAADPSLDCNLNGIPDACEPVPDRLLTSSIGFAGDGGSAVATDGETIVLGLPTDPTLDVDAGAAVVHRRVGTRWLESIVLLAGDASANDRFGASVSVDGDWIAVGAPGANIGPLEGAGAVYIFRRVAGNWTLHTKLTLAGAQADDAYGTAVAISGDTVVAGAPQVVPDLQGGRATLHVFDGASWTLTLDLAPVGLVAGDAFGSAVDIEGDRAAVAAPHEQGLVQNNSGAVRTYQRIGGIWLPNTRVVSTVEQQNARFGHSVTVSGLSLAIGAPGQDGDLGAVHLFRQIGLGWSPETTLASPAAAPDEFGHAVSLSGTALLAGEPRTNGNLGIAHLFDRVGGVWTFRESRVPVTNLPGDRLGSAVALSERTAVVGAIGRPGADALWVHRPLDCDGDGIEDICAIADGFVADCDLDGVPDSCRIADGSAADCDSDGVIDACQIAAGTASDCNLNGRLDTCDILLGAPDCNGNGAPDECDLDCDGSGTPDDCDILAGIAADCDGNGIVDSCDIAFGFAEDCNGNGVPDPCDLATGTSQDCDLDGALDECAIAAGLAVDCNGNLVPDACDLAFGGSQDCNGTGVPDECDVLAGVSDDCDGNGTPDECDFVAGAPDCNLNGILDVCDIAGGVSDDCDGDTVPDECQFAAGALDCNGNGVLDSCDIAVGVVVDATPPSITGLPGDTTLAIDPGACTAVLAWPGLSITDDCQLASSVVSHPSGTAFPVGATTVTATATDIHGNTTTITFVVTVVDATPPTTVGAPGDQVIPAEPGLCGATVSFALPLATDPCGVLSVIPSIVPGAFLPVGTTPVAIVSTDIHGNATTDTFTVTVEDTEPPLLTSAPTDVVLAAQPGICGAVVTWEPPTASDACGVTSLEVSSAPGILFPVGVTPVTVTATDAAGNAASTTFTISVLDDESPTILGLPGAIVVPNAPGTCAATATWDAPLATDNCPGSTLSLSAASGDAFPVGTTVVDASATDASGNATSASFTVTVVDVDAPTLSGAPVDIVAATDPGSCTALVAWVAPTVADNCPGATVGASHPSGSTFPAGVTTVTLTATDGSGNTSESVFTVTVEDLEAPTIAALPEGPVVGTDPGVCGAVVAWEPPTALDACPGATVETSHASGSFFTLGETVVSATVIDAAGNTATESFTVTVVDTEAPSIVTEPTDLTVPVDPGVCGATVVWTPAAATDACGAPSVTASAAPGDLFPVGTTVITTTAIDAAGNEATTSFTVTVVDDEAPQILGTPTAMTVSTDPGTCGAMVGWAAPSVLDACAGATLASSHASGTFFPVGTTTVTLTATDGSGNEEVDTFTVTVVDEEGPVIAGIPADSTTTTDPTFCSAIVSWNTITATDPCGAATVETSVPSGASFPLGVTVVTVTATDATGNVSTAGFSITVEDTRAPLLSGVPANVTISADPGACGTIVDFLVPSATDNCSTATVTTSHAPGSVFPVGSTTVSFTATDDLGNSASAMFTITVVDDLAPVITTSGAIVVPVDPAGCSATVVVPSPIVSDGCSVASLTNDFTGSEDASGVYPYGDTLVTWTATDDAGNVATATQLVTVAVGDTDCDGNGIPDACDIADGSVADCNGNGIPDLCDVSSGASSDVDGDGVPDECQPWFLRGDANRDTLLDLADGITILSFLFQNGPIGDCPAAFDANDDAAIQLSDAITVFSYFFSGGAPPPPPFGTCGVDPTPDAELGCASTVCP